jgi:polysaccharide export outer membrane protein
MVAIIRLCPVAMESLKVGGRTMRFSYVLLVGLSAGFLIDHASGQSQVSSPMLIGAHSVEGSSSSVVASPSDKAMGQISKDNGATSHTSPAHVMEKLSNIVSDEYTIGAEDVLEITVWRNQDLSKTVQVRPDGRFSMPVIRDVVAVGKTPSQLADEITRKLREYVQNPVVAISVKEVNSYSIFVLGEVVKPGKYPLKSRTTLLQGITIAGGFTTVAARNQVVVFRFGENGSGMQTLTSSYDDIVLRGGIGQNLELRAGDTVVVPSEAMVVFPGLQNVQ